MSTATDYRREVPCPVHFDCRLSPVERCTATATSTSQRCSNRAAPGSLACPAHGGPVWSPDLAHLRRGDPAEVVHCQPTHRYPDTLPEPTLVILTAWGPLGDSQVDAVVEGWNPDQVLDEILH